MDSVCSAGGKAPLVDAPGCAWARCQTTVPGFVQRLRGVLAPPGRIVQCMSEHPGISRPSFVDKGVVMRRNPQDAQDPDVNHAHGVGTRGLGLNQLGFKGFIAMDVRVLPTVVLDFPCLIRYISYLICMPCA